MAAGTSLDHHAHKEKGTQRKKTEQHANQTQTNQVGAL
jgi:hypothetical protein